MPAALGGLEVDPVILVEVIEELSRADASAGWCTAIANATAFFAWLDPVVAADLLAGRADIAVSGSFAPLGRLAPTRAGYRLTGRWPFVSGCRHADWFFQGGFVMEGEAPRMIPGRGPDWRLTALPASAVEIIDNWDVAGLRGTGSHDVAVAGVDVPEAYTIAPFFQPANHPGPIWRFPFFTLIGTLFRSASVVGRWTSSPRSPRPTPAPAPRPRWPEPGSSSPTSKRCVLPWMLSTPRSASLARAPSTRTTRCNAASATCTPRHSTFMILHETAFRDGGAVPRKYRELAALAVAMHKGCGYCVDTPGAGETEIAEIAFVAAAVSAVRPSAHGPLALRLRAEG